MATHPGVSFLRSSETDGDADAWGRTYITRTAGQAVCRSLPAELGLRPFHHRPPRRAGGHPCLTVLADQLGQVLHTRLRAQGEPASWATLRRILAGLQRVTATFRRPDGRTLPSRTGAAGPLRRARRRPAAGPRPPDDHLTGPFPRCCALVVPLAPLGRRDLLTLQPLGHTVVRLGLKDETGINTMPSPTGIGYDGNLRNRQGGISMPHEATRRSFFHGMLGSAAVAAAAQQALAQQDSPNGLPTRRLGRTGEQVSILCLGGWHIGAVEDKNEAVRIMHAAIDEGLTFFDNAWDYHDGGSEEIMGRALSAPGKRDQVFLMTKNCERDYKGSLSNLEDSLRRMQTDRIDLWQFHEMCYDSDPDWVFEKGGLKAALEAQKAGKVRYIGFTGHKDPSIHNKMLNKPYDWASAQMPINVLDAHYRSFQKEVVPSCLARDVGVVGMKGLGGGSPRGRIPSQTAATYEECRRYSLSLPVSTMVVGIVSMEELQAEVAIARDFKPMSDEEKAVLLAKVADEAGDGRHELFKSTQRFDGPHHRKQHGFALA